MSARTRLPFETFRTRLDAALSQCLGASALTRQWSGKTLQIWGPGCQGSATFDEGHFRGAFELTGLAWLMRGRICDDLLSMLRAAGCEEVYIG